MDLFVSTTDSVPTTSDGTIDWSFFVSPATLASAPAGPSSSEPQVTMDAFVCSLG